jgi:DNA-binding transcriptional MerR regulator
VSGIRTNAAAELLGVSPNTLRSWERRFGYPKPRRTQGGHRQYDLTELEALRRGALITLVLVFATALAACSGNSDESEPADGGAGGTATVADGEVAISADNLEFDASTIEAPAGAEFTITRGNNAHAYLDQDDNGKLELIAAGLDRHVYAWHANGTPVAGFPVLVMAGEEDILIPVRLSKRLQEKNLFQSLF